MQGKMRRRRGAIPLPTRLTWLPANPILMEPVQLSAV
jgi:hypothetical protein